mgnify:CR=1 FL=1
MTGPEHYAAAEVLLEEVTAWAEHRAAMLQRWQSQLPNQLSMQLNNCWKKMTVIKHLITQLIMLWKI